MHTANAGFCDYCGLPLARAAARSTAAHAQPAYCCYGCTLAAAITRGRGEAGQATLTLTRLGAAILLAMNVSAFSTFIYSQQAYAGGAPPADSAAHATELIFRYLSLFFSIGVMLLLGWPILANALRELRGRRFNTDLLIAIGVLAAFVYSYVAVLRGAGALYFEVACMTLVLVTLGRYLEATGKIRTTAALSELEALLPDTVVRVVEGARQTIRIGEIRIGDLVLVQAGARIPVDGQVADGQASVDQQTLTGESEPQFRGPGDRVLAGTLNLDGLLTIRATAAGDHSVMSGVIALLHEARLSRGFYQRIADRISTIFVPLVVVIAAVSAGFAASAGVDVAIMRGLSVLLISCPCALGVATPMALWIALGRAARRGLLFRDMLALERLALVRRVVFDKTGTLTTGQPQVAEFRVLPGRLSTQHTLALAGSLAQSVTHPLCAGVSRYVAARDIALPPLADVRAVAGMGVVGRSPADAALGLGSPALMDACGFRFDPGLRQFVDQLVTSGQTVVCIGAETSVEAVFGFSEHLRPETPAMIRQLRREGIDLLVLTGDHAGRATRLAAELDVPVEAGLLPQDKIRRIRELRRDGRVVAMVGDGVNDAPALAAADVGIAMGQGAEVSRESSDVCLVRDDLSAVPWAIDLARRTVSTIRQNLFWAFIYNVVGIGLAATGRLNPIFAAAAMVVSSLCVVGNSLRLGRTRPGDDS
ncbi:MAG: putative copper-exporting P-type ATPase V [Phycisphaerae bacterium]|nr:putative copper-exporting P-type ATPase V [Phycisphaerae bacterium]